MYRYEHYMLYVCLKVRSRLEKDMETLRKEKKQLVEDNHVSTNLWLWWVYLSLIMMIAINDDGKQCNNAAAKSAEQFQCKQLHVLLFAVTWKMQNADSFWCTWTVQNRLKYLELSVIWWGAHSQWMCDVAEDMPFAQTGGWCYKWHTVRMTSCARGEMVEMLPVANMCVLRCNSWEGRWSVHIHVYILCVFCVLHVCIVGVLYLQRVICNRPRVYCTTVYVLYFQRAICKGPRVHCVCITLATCDMQGAHSCVGVLLLRYARGPGCISIR